MPEVALVASPAPRRSRRPFAVQAAGFSLCAAPAAALIGLYAGQASPAVARSVEWVRQGTLDAGAGLGVAALLAMPWSGGWRRVAGRAIVGVTLVVAVVLTVRRTRLLDGGDRRFGPIGPDPRWLVGRWLRRTVSNGSGVEELLSVRADGSFREQFRTVYGLSIGDWTGRWSLDENQLVEDVDPANVVVGPRIGHHHWDVGPLRIAGREMSVFDYHQNATLRYAKVPERGRPTTAETRPAGRSR